MVTLSEITRRIDGSLSAQVDGIIVGINSLEQANGQELSFVHQARYAALAKQTNAAAILVSSWLPDVPCPQIKCASPYLAVAQLSQWLFPKPDVEPGIDARAVVDPSASIAPSARIEPLAVIQANAIIGEKCHIMAHAVVGSHVQMDEGCTIYPHVILYEHVRLGKRVTIHSGAVIGADGFGYAYDPASQKRYKIPQRGDVVIHDDVEIGANTTIDRATFGSTVLQEGCKIDNQVQLGHNVTLGQHSVIASQSGVAGSTTIGERATIGAQVGINGHIAISNHVMLAGRSGVIHPIKEPGIYGGMPAIAHRRWLRGAAIGQTLPELRERIRQLEQQLLPANHSPEANG